VGKSGGISPVTAISSGFIIKAYTKRTLSEEVFIVFEIEICTDTEVVDVY
jgi:hypothetical protein